MYRLKCKSPRATVICLIENKDETLKRIDSARKFQWDHLQLDTVTPDREMSYISLSADVIQGGTFEIEDLTKEADDRMVRCDGCHKAIRVSQTEMDADTGACICPSCQKDSEAGYMAKLEELRSALSEYLKNRTGVKLIDNVEEAFQKREEAFHNVNTILEELNEVYPFKEEER